MEEKKIKPIFSFVLTIALLAACSSQPNTPTVQSPQTNATEPATEAPATAEGGVPVAGTGLCANAYYPVRQGATWNYKSTGSPAGEYSFTDTVVSVGEDSFILATQSGNLTRTQEWACKPEGLVALQFGGAPAALLDAQGLQLDVQSSNASGVTFPSEIKPGDQWQHRLYLQGNVSVANQSGAAKGDAQNNFTAAGVESVTVPAGTFDAMKIKVDTIINMNVSYKGLSLPVEFSGSYTYWFVQGVGWVKASGTGSAAGTSFSETIELQSYSVP
ncbi:MAG TPA: hypothetical protein VLE49_02875 [Anaerolineales bacterium]|nr:hypothetical protein [Anaerolineales bacterium]